MRESNDVKVFRPKIGMSLKIDTQNSGKETNPVLPTCHTTEAEREGVKSETIITCSLQQVNQQQKHVKSARRTNKIKMRETHLRHTTDASHS